MAKGKVTITDHTGRIVKQVTRFTRNGLIDFVDSATAAAAKGSPYKTGNNRSMIRQHPEGAGFIIATESEYGGFLELGTAHMAARPYFVPAIQQTIRDFDTGNRWNR